MKLLLVIECPAAGAGRHVADLTEGLLERGHEVHLLHSNTRADQVFHRDRQRLLESTSFHSRDLPMLRRPALRDIIAASVLRRYVHRRGPFDLVHAHSSKAGFIARLGLAGMAVKRLYTPHGFFTTDPSLGPSRRLAVAQVELALSKLCDGVVVVSRAEHAGAIRLGIARDKLHLIRNGVAPPRTFVEKEMLRRELGLSPSEVCVGFVGRLVPVKAPDTILRAFAVLIGVVPAARLAMVGDGPLAIPCRTLARKLGIESRILWLGERDARALMGAFDVLALTSEAEAAGLVVLEALARGLPVVATPVGIVPEAVRPGVNGFIAPVHGIQEMAGALSVLAGNPSLRERMGQASLVLSRDFSLDRMVDQTVAVYQKLVEGSATRAGTPRKEAAAAR